MLPLICPEKPGLSSRTPRLFIQASLSTRLQQLDRFPYPLCGGVVASHSVLRQPILVPPSVFAMLRTQEGTENANLEGPGEAW